MEPDVYDGPWKLALEHLLEAFFALFLPVAHAEVDWARGYRFLDKELQQALPEGSRGGEGVGVVDKLVEVWLRSGEPAYAHVEVETTPSEPFPARMERYHRRLRDKLGDRLTSVAVLGDRDSRWRPERWGRTWWGTETLLRFVSIKLLDWERGSRWRQLQASTNPFALVVLAHLQTARTKGDPARRLYWKRRLILHLDAEEHGWTPEQKHVLYRCLEWMMRLPPEQQDALDAELRELREEGKVEFVTSIERKASEEATVRTRRDTTQENVLKFLHARFGEPSPELVQRVRAIVEPDVLDALITEAARAESLSAFVSELPPSV